MMSRSRVCLVKFLQSLLEKRAVIKVKYLKAIVTKIIRQYSLVFIYKDFYNRFKKINNPTPN